MHCKNLHKNEAENIIAVHYTHFNQHNLLSQTCINRTFLQVVYNTFSGDDTKKRSSSLLFDVRCSTFTYPSARNGVRTGNICSTSRILPVEMQSLFSAFVFLQVCQGGEREKKCHFTLHRREEGCHFLLIRISN